MTEFASFTFAKEDAVDQTSELSHPLALFMDYLVNCTSEKSPCRVGLLRPATDAAPSGGQWRFITSQLPYSPAHVLSGAILWSQGDFFTEITPGALAQVMPAGGALLVIVPQGPFEPPLQTLGDLAMNEGGFFRRALETQVPEGHLRALEAFMTGAGAGESCGVPTGAPFSLMTRICSIQVFLREPSLPPSFSLPPPSPAFYDDWKALYPELEIMMDGITDILTEVQAICSWTPWPEKHYSDGGKEDWKVFPFVHCFPANNPSCMKWIESNCSKCPRTASLLKKLPSLRTALFSRLGAATKISSHRGWSSLANHVLRCHISLVVPGPSGSCGVWVEGEMRSHKVGKMIVFDDSKLHKAFNDNAEDDRLVLILDLLRPEHIASGRARGDVTVELEALVACFS